MLIGIFSDTHDHLMQMDKALALFRKRRVKAVVHAGDIVSPFAARKLAAVKVPLFVVYGNNDGEKAGLKSVLPDIAKGPIEFELGGLAVALTHDPARIPKRICERSDIVITGHTHEPEIEADGGILRINPGETCGWVNGRSTVAILNTSGKKAEIVDLPLD